MLQNYGYQAPATTKNRLVSANSRRNQGFYLTKQSYSSRETK